MKDKQPSVALNGPRRHLKAEAVAKEPYLVWNAFIDLIALEEYEALSAVQRTAQLAFYYDAEVQNGGHHQYFENSAGMRSEETLKALVQLGLQCQAEILRQTIPIWSSKDREPPATPEEYLADELEGEFEDYDSRYYKCSPTTTDRLELYLSEHQSDFVIVEGAA
jgi:hypothetical protein